MKGKLPQQTISISWLIWKSAKCLKACGKIDHSDLSLLPTTKGYKDVVPPLQAIGMILFLHLHTAGHQRYTSMFVHPKIAFSPGQLRKWLMEEHGLAGTRTETKQYSDIVLYYR